MMKATGSATWKGTWKEGSGTISTQSDTLKEKPSSFASRFEGAPGASPEELLAAALAGCYNQALANSVVLSGFEAEHIETTVLVEMTIKGPHGHPAIEGISIEVRAKAPGMPQDKFDTSAEKARVHCSIAEALNINPKLDATLLT